MSLVLIAVVFIALRPGRNQTGSAPQFEDYTATSSVSVVLTEKGFVPAYFRIKKGTTVVFSTTRGKDFWPASNEHPEHSIYPQFDPKEPVMPSKTWSFTFDKAGQWGFHDHIRSYFTGVVEVIE